MSLILEALRKSEAERQIGRAPGLLTPMPVLRSSRRRHGWRWATLLGALLLAAALGAAWWLGRSGAQPAADDRPPDASARATAGEPHEAPATTPAAAPPMVATAAPAAPAPREALPAAGPVDHPSDPDFASTERESLPMPPADATRPRPVAVPPVAPPAASAAATASPSPAAADVAPVPVDEWLPPLRTLTEAERGGLPPLRMSMHVYNEDPARRFVLVDGRRRVEGDVLGEGVRIERIRRDGAVLELRGRRVLLERP